MIPRAAPAFGSPCSVAVRGPATQSQYAGTQYTAPGNSTAGWRNIGLCGADVLGNGGTYIDGVKATGASTDWGLALNKLVKFGTLGSIGGPGIKLYEQLTYIRSFNRAWANGVEPRGGGAGWPPPGPGTPYGPFDPCCQ